MSVSKLPALWVICPDTEPFRELSFSRKLQEEKEWFLTRPRSSVFEQLENKEKHFYEQRTEEMTEVAVPKPLQLNAPTQFSSVSWTPEDRVFHTPCPGKLSSQRWSPALLMILQRSITGQTLQLWGDASGDGTALCAAFLPCREAVENSQWSQKAVHIPLGKEGCWTQTLFSQPGGKKTKPSLNFIFWLFNSILWSECISPYSIW